MFNFDSNVLLARLGKLILFALPLLGTISMLGTLALGQYNLFTLSLYAAIPMILAPLAYYPYYTRQAKTENLPDGLFIFLLICFLTVFTESIILLNTSDVRSYWYYAAISATAVFTLLQIVLFNVTPRKLALVFAQIILISLNLIWGVTLKYYYFIGRTDTLAHAGYAQTLLEVGHVTEAFGLYSSFPLWHIMVDAAYMVTGSGFPVYKMMFIVSGLVYAVTPIAIYVAVARLVSSRRIGLIAALLISVQTFFLFDGMYSIARGAVTLLMLSLILLLLSSNDRRKFWLAILMTFGILLYHTVSILFVLAILLVLYVLQKILVKESKPSFLSLKYFAISVAMVAVYWGLFASPLTTTLYGNLVLPAPAGIATSSIVETPLSEVANYLQYTPLLFFIIIGIIYILREKNFNGTARIFGVATLLFLPVIFPGPLLLFNKLSLSFNIDRFHDYGFIFTTTLAALGFAALFYKAGRYVKVCLVAIFALMVILSIANDFVASDNPLVKRPFFTFYLTENEVNSINHLSNLTAPQGYLMSDYIVKRYMDFSPYVSLGQFLEMNNGKLLKNSADDIALVRESELAKRPLRTYTSLNETYKVNPPYSTENRMGYYYSSDPAWSTLNSMDLVYNSNDVSGFR